jgi:hypothetical protein
MSFFKKFARGTSSKTRRPTMNITTPDIPTPKPEIAAPPPAKHGKKEVEAEQQEEEETDDKLVKPEPSARSQSKKQAPKAEEGAELTGHKTATTADIDAENIYHLSWREEESYRMIPERKTRVNQFYPNAISMFKLLEAAEKRINYSKHIQEHEVNYLPYAVKVYYGIMFYMQILEARFTAGEATGFENSLLKRFKAKYPRDSLPCAEIVYGYFNTVAATELADQKYDWIVPAVCPLNARTDMHTIDTSTGYIYLQPQVPYMLAILNSFIHSNNIATLMEEGERFTPDLTSATAANIQAFGFDVPNNAAGTAAQQQQKSIFAANGIDTPCTFGNGNYPSAQRFARDSDFGRQISIVVNTATAQTGIRAPVMTMNISDLDRFLHMEKTSNLKWFSFLREQAVIHARFFDQVYHFSDVQTTCGLETTILCKLKTETAAATAGRGYFYESSRLGIDATTHAAGWYPNVFADLTGGFATNRSGVKRNEELQALTHATNASLPIRTANNANPIAALTEDDGPIWTNTEWIKSYQYANDVQGKPMYTGLNSVTLRCYREKPHGTGVVDNQF